MLPLSLPPPPRRALSTPAQDAEGTLHDPALPFLAYFLEVAEHALARDEGGFWPAGLRK